MKNINFIAFIMISILCTSCKMKQVDMSKVYDSCWVDDSGGLDSELCFYKNHTAKLSSTSIIKGEKINSVTMFTYNYVDGKIYLTPNEADQQYAKLYAIIVDDKVEVHSENNKSNVVYLKKK